MLKFGQQLAASLKLPAVLELVGDVGVGKTTLTRGLAQGLGVQEPITSPSFTISKRYAFRRPSDQTVGELVHYDFYRLADPGIMQNDLAEAIAEPQNVVVVEWGDSIANLLPRNKLRLEITLQENGHRKVTATPVNPVENLCKTCGKTVENSDQNGGKLAKTSGKEVEK